MDLQKNQSEFSYVLRANELAKKIADTAFLIKLNALNALLLAIRVDDEMRGYIVVTDEFIKFSSGLINFAESLRTQLFQQVSAISNHMKHENKARLLNAAIATSSQSIFLDSVSEFIQDNLNQMNQFVESMTNSSLSVINELRQSERFVMRGDILAMQAKIEGAYAGTSREIFDDVADSLQRSINTIKTTLQQMEQELNHTYTEFNSKNNMLKEK